MAGLLDKLTRNIALGMNPNEPLFGGLIPRRVIEPPIIQEPTGRIVQPPTPNTIQPPVRRTGLDRASEQYLSGGVEQPRDVKIDWTGQRLDLDRAKHSLDTQKFLSDREESGKEFGLKSREQNRKEIDDKNRLDLDSEKHELDLRKQALDEWKTRNPEGQIQTTADGKIMIVDRRTGQSIDTGLLADALSEEKKLELQAKNAAELEGIRQKNRLALEKAKNKTNTGDRINPSQQRTAERDAANELLNDRNYSWLADKGYIEFGEDGNLVIKRPDKSRTQENFTIDAFERDLKSKAEERMNKTFKRNVNDNTEEIEEDTVDMIAPDGGKLKVPKNEVQQMRNSGAKLAVEAEGLVTPMPEVRDDIELFYDAQGRVIGARNKKNPKISKFEEQ